MPLNIKLHKVDQLAAEPSYTPAWLAALAAEVHIWLAPSTLATAALDVLIARLNAPERQRYARLQRLTAQQQFLVAHNLKRYALSHYRDIPPQAWDFAISIHGRPSLTLAMQQPQLFFSLSHTHGLCACAVARTPHLGVDLEYCRALPQVAALAARCMPPAAYTQLLQHDTPTQTAEFLAHWTLQEAYAKALGLGLKAPFQQIILQLNRTQQQATLHPTAYNYHLAPSWQLLYQQLTQHHLALAVGGLPA